jgi:hypothetical protein
MLSPAPAAPPPPTWGVLAAAIGMSEVATSEVPVPHSRHPRRSAWAKWVAAGVIVAAGAYTAIATGACAAALRLVH